MSNLERHVRKGYDIYTVRQHLGMQDPLMGPTKRYHHILFVETKPDGSGHIFNVTGDIMLGMKYESSPSEKPELSEVFHEKVLLGRVPVDKFPDTLDEALRSLPAPPRQRTFSPKTMQYEQCKPDGSIYGPDEEKPPYIKCTEWTEQRAIPALRQQGLIRDDLEKACI